MRRKEAYREGYLAALREFDRLASMGFVRESERRNLMMLHAGAGLRSWVYDKTQRDVFKAPSKAWNGPTWWKVREAVLGRDGAFCSECGATDHLEIDHIHEVKEGGIPNLDNLRVLCKACNVSRNSQKTTRRGRK